MNRGVIDKAFQVITFRIGDEEYGLNILQVQEIIKFIAPVTVPKAPDYVEGVINLRGKIIPIIDLRKRLNKEITPYTDLTKIIIVDMGQKISGLIVDEVIDVIMLKDIENCPYIHEERRSEYIMGIGKQDNRLVSLLNLDNIL